MPAIAASLVFASVCLFQLLVSKLYGLDLSLDDVSICTLLINSRQWLPMDGCTTIQDMFAVKV
jgi:hypothetical protein